MSRQPECPEPDDATARRAAQAVVCYDVDQLPPVDLALYHRARDGMTKVDEVTVPPRDGGHFSVPAGHFFRVVSVEGPQVGDMNLWNANDLSERFFSGKTRQMHATHVSTGDLLRRAVEKRTPMGEQVKRVMETGRLVTDELVWSLVREHLSDDQMAKGFLLDGFPRSEAQRTMLRDHLARLALTMSAVLCLNVDPEEVIRRNTARRLCPSCHRVYNVHTNPPGTEGVCDACGTDLLREGLELLDRSGSQSAPARFRAAVEPVGSMASPRPIGR